MFLLINHPAVEQIGVESVIPGGECKSHLPPFCCIGQFFACSYIWPPAAAQVLPSVLLNFVGFARGQRDSGEIQRQ